MLVIRLQSSDKEVFEVNRDVISLSSTLDTMLRGLSLHSSSSSLTNTPHPCSDLGFDSNDAEDVGDPIPLANVNSEILKKVLEWCVHHKDDPPTESLSDEHSCDDLSAWDFEFFSVDLEKHFKILEAANYLEVSVIGVTEWCHANEG